MVEVEGAPPWLKHFRRQRALKMSAANGGVARSNAGVGRKKQKQNRDCHFNEAKLFFMTKQPRAVLRLISPAGGKADNGDRDRNSCTGQAMPADG